MAGLEGQIEIRIRPGGRVYMDGVSEGILEMAAALNPGDPYVMRRLEMLQALRAQRASTPEAQEQADGDAEASH